MEESKERKRQLPVTIEVDGRPVYMEALVSRLSLVTMALVEKWNTSAYINEPEPIHTNEMKGICEALLEVRNALIFGCYGNHEAR